MTNPYAALGLQRNPFALDEALAVPDWLWLDCGHSDAPTPGQRRMVQLVGVKGAGKSSHLFRWQAQRPGPYHYVAPAWHRRWRWLPVAPIVYWDELDRLPQPLRTLSLWRAARAGATLCVGTHVDLSADARRAGLAVTTIVLGPIVEPSLLIAWAARRIAQAALPDAAPLLVLDEATAASILAQSEGSWRIAADYLHIWAAQASNDAMRRWSDAHKDRLEGTASR